MYIEIPNNVQPYWSATINNKTYIYPAGTTQDVPEEVFNLIYNLQLSEEQHVGYSAQASDMNQNDPTATDYIKNRTHWVETGHVTFAQDVTAEIGDQPVYGLCDGELVVGQTYEVIWDGNSYSCVAYAVETIGNAPAIGNGSIAGASGGNGEPFFCYFFNGKLGWGAVTGGVHTFTFSGEGEFVHKLDPKYLSDIVLTAPNGTKFTLSVKNNGEIYAYNPSSGPV